MAPRVVELFVYPIKSAGGVRIEEARVDRRGIVLDRRWMVVDPEGMFLTQRAHPRMVLLDVAIERDHLRVAFPKMPAVHVPFAHRGERIRATVWKDTCDGVVVPGDVSLWFTEALGTPCRLVHMADDFARPARPSPRLQPADEVGFADAFPFLLTSLASLEELNGRLDAPVPMNRFRPNVVVDGAPAFAEDGWARLETSGVTFRVAKPRARCVIVCTDQATAERSVEPLRTMAMYRTVDRGVMFGVNLLHDAPGTLGGSEPA